MFTLKVTEDEIQKALKCLKANVYPSSIGLWDIAWNVFYKVDSKYFSGSCKIECYMPLPTPPTEG